MAAADLDALVALWVASWREAMPDIDFSPRRAWIAEFLRAPKHRTLVAETIDGLVGFVSLEGNYLHQLVVAPAAKGTGIARRLLDTAKDATKADRAESGTSTSLTLDVNQANARAVRFYTREGFVRTSAGINPASKLPTWTMCWRP